MLRKIGKWMLMGLGALMVLAVIASIVSPPEETARSSPSQAVGPDPSDSVQESASVVASASAAPVEPAPTADAGLFGDGTHAVGSDIQPGTYRGEGGGLCYWERLSGFGGTFEEIIANGAAEENPVVTIEASDAGFETQGCGNWTDDLSAITSSPTAPFEDGTFIVGTDIAPGNWRARGGDSCYWERLSDFTGEFDGIIANGAAATNPIVAIDATDAGFQTAGCGEWTQGS